MEINFMIAHQTNINNNFFMRMFFEEYNVKNQIDFNPGRNTCHPKAILNWKPLSLRIINNLQSWL